MLFEASVAVTITVVVPIGNVDPDGGVETNETPEQLSHTVGIKLTTAPAVEVAPVTILAGQVTMGGSVSLTVTVNEQLGPAIVVTITVVEPTVKNDPEGGTTLTIPHDPLVVGLPNVTTAPH